MNNAGMALGTEPAQAGDLKAWKQMVDVNIHGVLNVTHHVLPKMVKRNAGHIINLGSIAATYPYLGGNVYGATKAFLQQFTRNLKADLLGTAIRVTNIEPGMVETEFSVVRFKGDEAKAKAVYAGMQPLVADDIAEMIVWAAMRPAHVNILSMEVMPVAQAFAGSVVTAVRSKPPTPIVTAITGCKKIHRPPRVKAATASTAQMTARAMCVRGFCAISGVMEGGLGCASLAGSGRLVARVLLILSTHFVQCCRGPSGGSTVSRNVVCGLRLFAGAACSLASS